jgi:hypothetical protein
VRLEGLGQLKNPVTSYVQLNNMLILYLCLVHIFLLALILVWRFSFIDIGGKARRKETAGKTKT